MSDIRPFPAIRYNTANGADLSARIAPPYDVLSEADKQELLGHDARNFVAIDLPHTPPKAAGPAEVYTGARQAMDRWLSDGTMVQEDAPAIYVYHQQYTYDGRTFTRKMFGARLRLEPFGTGSVYPHEQTFGGPKEDRLALTKACEANMSPIFGLYPDPHNEIAAKLDAVTSAEPLMTGTLGGIENRVWVVKDEALTGVVQQLMADKAVYIADGHHRYGTGLMHQQWASEQHGPLAADDPANFVLCVFCAMEDPGLLILPTHRVLANLIVPVELLAKDAQIEVSELSVDNPSAAIEAVGQFGPQAVAMYAADEKRYLAVRPKSSNILDELAGDHSPAWRMLGVAFLQAYLLDQVIKPALSGGEQPEVRYIKSDAGAIDEAAGTNGTAFLMQPNTMDELSGVCQAGDLMPQKSTFFYPKIASGFFVNPLR
jgi:uncharacterized protein (DUF1015 family)